MSHLARRLNAVRLRQRGGKNEEQKEAGEVDKSSGKVKGYKRYAEDGVSGLDERHLKVVAVKLAEYPLALDMLVFILNALIEKRKESRNIDKKFTEIKATTQKFVNTIGLSGKWGVELMKIAGFRKSGEWYKIANIDSARLWLVKTFLEEERKTPVYKLTKKKVDFERIVDKAIADTSTEENAKRAELALKVPPPPPIGSGGSAKIFVFLGAVRAHRFFNGDDMLSQVLMWIGANYSSTIPEKLESGEYELVNKSFFPGKLLDYKASIHRTLFGLDLSPSGELQIQQRGLFDEERRMNGL